MEYEYIFGLNISTKNNPKHNGILLNTFSTLAMSNTVGQRIKQSTISSRETALFNSQ